MQKILWNRLKQWLRMSMALSSLLAAGIYAAFQTAFSRRCRGACPSVRAAGCGLYLDAGSDTIAAAWEREYRKALEAGRTKLKRSFRKSNDLRKDLFPLKSFDIMKERNGVRKG